MPQEGRDRTVPTFNPPPGWDTPTDPTWTPPPGWEPKAWWPPAPDGWQFWISDTPAVTAQPVTPPVTPPFTAGRVPVVALASRRDKETPKDPPATAYPSTGTGGAPSQSFWTLRMSGSQWVVFAVTVVLGGLAWGASSWNQARNTRADRIESAYALCTQAVRDMYLGQYTVIDTLEEQITPATVDGDLAVNVTGSISVGRREVSYSCTVRHDGVWSDMGGWQLPVVAVAGV